MSWLCDRFSSCKWSNGENESKIDSNKLCDNINDSVSLGIGLGTDDNDWWEQLTVRIASPNYFRYREIETHLFWVKDGIIWGFNCDLKNCLVFDKRFCSLDISLNLSLTYGYTQYSSCVLDIINGLDSINCQINDVIFNLIKEVLALNLFYSFLNRSFEP